MHLHKLWPDLSMVALTCQTTHFEKAEKRLPWICCIIPILLKCILFFFLRTSAGSLPSRAQHRLRITLVVFMEVRKARHMFWSSLFQRGQGGHMLRLLIIVL